MELSTDTRTNVVVTKLGDFWVSTEKAKSIASGIDDKAGRVVIEEFGIVAMNQVFAVLTKEGYEVYQRKQSGSWQCDKKVWHEKFTKCNCVKTVIKTPEELGMATDNRSANGDGFAKFQEMKRQMLK